MATGVQTPSGMRQKVHNHELCQFYTGKDVTILSSQGPENLKDAIRTRYQGDAEELMRCDLIAIMKQNYGIRVSDTVLSTDDYMRVENYGARYGDTYKDQIRPYEQAYKTAINDADKQDFSSHQRVIAWDNLQGRLNEERNLKEEHAKKLLGQAEAFDAACAQAHQYILDKHNDIRTKGHTLEGYLQSKSTPKDHPICMTDDKSRYLDSILEQCKGRHLYLYLTDTKKDPATIVRYGIDPHTNQPGPIGDPIRLSDFTKLDKIQKNSGRGSPIQIKRSICCRQP